MIYSFPYGVPYGNHEWIITQADFRVINSESSFYALTWTVADGCDDFYRIAVDGARVKVPVYCVAGIQNQMILEMEEGEHLISICPQGSFGDPAIRIQDQINAHFEDGRHFANHFQTIIRSRPTASIAGTTQLTGITSAGLQRGTNVAPSPGRPTWGVLDLTLETDGGVHTITASVNGRAMLTGSRTGDGEIELTGARARITMTLTYSADFDSGVQLVFRWPQRFSVYRKPSPFVEGDFPRTPDASLQDDGSRNNYIYKSPPLDAGTYYLVIHAIGDDNIGSLDIQSGGLPITVYNVPREVENLAYVSGGGTDTVIGWDCPASDPLVTYNYYDSLDTGALETTTPTGTHAAGASNTQALADIGTYTGKRYVVVRSVSGGIEDPSLSLVEIDYVAGERVTPKACPAASGETFSTNELNLSVPVSIYIDPNYEYPGFLEVYVYPLSTSPDYETPTTLVSCPPNPANTPSIIVESPALNEENITFVNESGTPMRFVGTLATVETSNVYVYELGTRSAVVALNEDEEPFLNENGDPVYLPGSSLQTTGIVYGPVILTDEAMPQPDFIVAEA